MPTDLFGGLSGVGGSDRWFDGIGNHTWASVGAGGTSTVWNTPAPIAITSMYLEWHYGGAYNQDGSPGSVSGAGGAFDIQGSADGSTGWTTICSDAYAPGSPDPWPNDFNRTYNFSVVTFQYFRFRSTGGSNNDIYTIAAYGPSATPRSQAVFIG
jgi:hypothetical protein